MGRSLWAQPDQCFFSMSYLSSRRGARTKKSRRPTLLPSLSKLKTKPYQFVGISGPNYAKRFYFLFIFVFYRAVWVLKMGKEGNFLLRGPLRYSPRTNILVEVSYSPVVPGVRSSIGQMILSLTNRNPCVRWYRMSPAVGPSYSWHSRVFDVLYTRQGIARQQESCFVSDLSSFDSFGCNRELQQSTACTQRTGDAIVLIRDVEVAFCLLVLCICMYTKFCMGLGFLFRYACLLFCARRATSPQVTPLHAEPLP